MNIVWGLLMAVIGAFFVLSALAESDNPVYRLLVARSKILWGERVHGFYQVVGAILMVLGLGWALSSL